MKLFVLAVALVVSGVSFAGTKVSVALAGRDDAIPKLGQPAVSVRVEAASSLDGAVTELVAGELARELRALVHTRELAASEAGDYELAIRLESAQVDGPVARIPFAATLASSRGERLWRVEGRCEVEGAAVDPSVYASIGRNVVSALIHDGWLTPRYDPEDPPPQPPNVR